MKTLRKLLTRGGVAALISGLALLILGVAASAAPTPTAWVTDSNGQAGTTFTTAQSLQYWVSDVTGQISWAVTPGGPSGTNTGSGGSNEKMIGSSGPLAAGSYTLSVYDNKDALLASKSFTVVAGGSPTPTPSDGNGNDHECTIVFDPATGAVAPATVKWTVSELTGGGSWALTPAGTSGGPFSGSFTGQTKSFDGTGTFAAGTYTLVVDKNGKTDKHDCSASFTVNAPEPAGTPTPGGGGTPTPGGGGTPTPGGGGTPTPGATGGVSGQTATPLAETGSFDSLLMGGFALMVLGSMAVLFGTVSRRQEA